MMNHDDSFTCQQAKELLLKRLDNQQKQGARAQWRAQLDEARAALASAQAAFADEPSQANADNAVRGAARVRELETIVGGLGNDDGGKDPLRTPENDAKLAAGFDERRRALAERLVVARRRLGAKLAELTEAGFYCDRAVYEPSALRLCGLCNNIEQAAHAALTHGNYCRQSPPKFDRTLEDLLNCLIAQLPPVT
jgi:hypothetical protein